MKAEDIIELEKNVITLIEHDAIIAEFQNKGNLNRANALDKYERFNNEHPDFLTLHVCVSVLQSQLVRLSEADNTTIVENMKCQHDWLYKKSVFKFGEEALKEYIQRMRDITCM